MEGWGKTEFTLFPKQERVFCLLWCFVVDFFFLNKHKCNVCFLSVLQQHRRRHNRVNTFQEEMIHDAVLRSLYRQSRQALRNFAARGRLHISSVAKILISH